MQPNHPNPWNQPPQSETERYYAQLNEHHRRKRETRKAVLIGVAIVAVPFTILLCFGMLSFLMRVRGV